MPGTSACDPGNEALLYGLLRERLSGFFDAESGVATAGATVSHMWNMWVCNRESDPLEGSENRIRMYPARLGMSLPL